MALGIHFNRLALPSLVRPAVAKSEAQRIRVQDGDDGLELIIDETVASCDRSGGLVWDALALPVTCVNSRPSVLILGLGGGTCASALRRLNPQATIVGVELDAEVIRLAKQHFNLDKLNIEVVNQDALHFLRKEKRQFDLIIDDVFAGYARSVKKPRWFPNPGLRLAKARLKGGGVLVSNALAEAKYLQRARLCLLFVLCPCACVAAVVNETCEAEDSALVQQSSIRPYRRGVRARLEKLEEQMAAMATQVQGLRGSQSSAACGKIGTKGVALDSMVAGTGRRRSDRTQTPKAAHAFVHDATNNGCTKCVTWAYDYEVTSNIGNWPRLSELQYIPMLKTPNDLTQANVAQINTFPVSTSSQNAVLDFNEIWQDFTIKGDSSKLCQPGGQPLSDLLDKIQTPPCYIAPGVTNLTESLTPIRELWMTEFAMTGPPGQPQNGPQFIDQLEFMCISLCGMEHDNVIKNQVDKYAWYAGFNPTDGGVQNNRLHRWKSSTVLELAKLGCFYQNFRTDLDCGKFADPNTDLQKPQGWTAATLESVMGGNGLGPCGAPLSSNTRLATVCLQGLFPKILQLRVADFENKILVAGPASALQKLQEVPAEDLNGIIVECPGPVCFGSPDYQIV
eukprot:symbB.v1.2.013045.t1/scaffold915.1/size152478/7